MKPSDRIKEMCDSLHQDGVWKEHEVIGIAITTYLDQEYESNRIISCQQHGIVDLLREIESQKFQSENKCARILTTRMVSRFNAWVAEHGEDAKIKELRVWMFGEDNK